MRTVKGTERLPIFGLIALVGGAIYSAFLFWRKKTLLNRMWGNMLIATWALVITFASTLTRFGVGDYLYIGELVSARKSTLAEAPAGGSE